MDLRSEITDIGFLRKLVFSTKNERPGIAHLSSGGLLSKWRFFSGAVVL